jgi:hypothetical protein
MASRLPRGPAGRLRRRGTPASRFAGRADAIRRSAVAGMREDGTRVAAPGVPGRIGRSDSPTRYVAAAQSRCGPSAVVRWAVPQEGAGRLGRNSSISQSPNA